MSQTTEICPMCGGTMAATNLECPHCGERPFGSSDLPANPDMLRQEHGELTAARRKHNMLGFAFGLPGLALQGVGAGLAAAEEISPGLGIAMRLGGLLIFAVGVYYVALYKGRNGAWALLSLIGCIGLIVLLVLKDYNKARLKEIESAMREAGLPVV